ncbi:hypothetical protein [Streptomyces sp. WMMC940]|uniref:hypothetical protein n=1 Tax=Streptomyces sp. WMMC940 TaxID=3015153 RepID=UPI0022B73FCD|nr:hypothetical protein [Streptomyces sp. WMMC940]MCZ7456182.1 hypothetical protein [Streptomyces sp. WMMC940]
MSAAVRAFFCTAPLALALFAGAAAVTATEPDGAADAGATRTGVFVAAGTVLALPQDDNGWW